jgi:hypothetical protein
MTSPICRETGVQIERTVMLGRQPGTWRVSHVLCHHGAAVVSWAPWIVAMILRSATVFLPTQPTSSHPQRVRTFANEGESISLRDRVLSFTGDVAMSSCREPLKFKYGTDGEMGAALAVIEVGPRGLVGLRKSVPTFHPKRYAHGCVAEVFNSPDFPYFEMELHGPVVALAPGDSFTLIEDAALFDLDDMPLDGTSIRKYLAVPAVQGAST